MKKAITSEVKIALVAICAIVVLFFGLQFLKGLNLFSSANYYRMKFTDISGLATATPVYANGVKVGMIKDISYNYENPADLITVGADIDKEMKIPVGTTANIVSDLMGNVKVNLILGKSATLLTPKEVINGQIDNGTVGQMQGMIPTIEQMLPKLDSIMARINMLLADPAVKGTVHNVEKITANLTTSTKELNLLMAQVNASLPALTGKTSTLLANTNDVMMNANVGITETRTAIKGANGMITKLNSQIDVANLQATMAKVNTTLDHVNSLTAKLNSKESSLGLLMSDPTLYNNLNKTMVSADSLLTNFKAHPKRYVHFSVFGRKDK